MFDRGKSDALFTDTLDLLDTLNTRDGRFEYADYVSLHNNITALYDSFSEVDELMEMDKAKAEGRLAVLPCKVGDEIFSFHWSVKNEKHEVHTGKVKNVRYHSSDGLVMISDGERYCVFGKTVFLSREEAEKALEGSE